MSMLLHASTVRHLATVLKDVRDEILRSVIHCEPSFITNLLGLEVYTGVRLRHQTHSSREVPLLGISQKTCPEAPEDVERTAQRRLMIDLARNLRPPLEALRLQSCMDSLARRGVERIAVLGATSTTLSLCDCISQNDRIIAVLDDQRSTYSTVFCGKPTMSLSEFLQQEREAPPGGVIMSCDPGDELALLSASIPLIRAGYLVCPLRQPGRFFSEREAKIEVLRTKAIHHNNGYFMRLLTILMTESGVNPMVVAEVTGQAETTIKTWSDLFDRYGLAALNYWVID